MRVRLEREMSWLSVCPCMLQAVLPIFNRFFFLPLECHPDYIRRYLIWQSTSETLPSSWLRQSTQSKEGTGFSSSIPLNKGLEDVTEETTERWFHSDLIRHQRMKEACITAPLFVYFLWCELESLDSAVLKRRFDLYFIFVRFFK